MSININGCKTAINNVKTNINNCFIKCNAKGSTYVESARTSNELIKKIDAIPLGVAPSTLGEGQSFELFSVSGDIFDDSFVTVNFKGVGTNWRGIFVYSDTKMGWLQIHKINNTHCIVSAMVVRALENELGFTTWVHCNSSVRCSYVISGSVITFTYDNIDPTLHEGMSSIGYMATLFYQVDEWDSTIPSAPETGVPYQLDKITIY